MKKLYALALAAALTIACGGSDSVTGSNPIPDSGGGFTAASVQPAPSPSPAAPSSTPEGDRPYVTFKEPLGEGEFCNTASHPLTLTVEYWNANNFSDQKLLEKRTFSAAPKTCVPLPPAADVVKLGCGEKVTLQIDAATTEHLGHVFVTLVGPEEKETVEVAVTYSDWSACSSGSAEADSQGCFKTRTKTTTTTKSYVCAAQVVEVVTVEEKESCTCPCVEEWKELKPEVTYSEWSECSKPSNNDYSEGHSSNKCYSTRTKTTVVKEQNSCTEQIREKSRKVETEQKECTCPVVQTCSNTPASSSAAQGFSLPNSGDATEIAWANLNVLLGPWKLQDKDEHGWGNWGKCWYADINNSSTAKVALVKAGTKFKYYLNVKDGDKLCSFDGKDISHITYFTCK